MTGISRDMVNTITVMTPCCFPQFFSSRNSEHHPDPVSAFIFKPVGRMRAESFPHFQTEPMRAGGGSRGVRLPGDPGQERKPRFWVLPHRFHGLVSFKYQWDTPIKSWGIQEASQKLSHYALASTVPQRPTMY